ncbi:MAG TPA: phage tail tape measure protein [Cyclobacteriaceae bacterium]|nr:phage tail tape measure protein [Cyclobacteriaceae bacterium]
MAAGDAALHILIDAQDNASSILSKFAGGHLGGIVTAGLAAGAALVGIGVAATKAAGDFQVGMTRLVTTAGETESNIKAVGDGILQLSVDTATSTKELSDGMYLIESAGFHGADGLNVLKAAAEGAKAEQASLGTVSDALTTVMHDYGMSSNQASNAMNGLITAVSSGKTNLEALSSAMGSVLPLASSLNIPFAQVAGALSTMTNSGMNAQRASQNLANAMRSLSAPSNVAMDAMNSVDLKAQDLKDTLSNKGLAAAIQLIEDHVGKKFPAGSVEAVTAFKDIMGGATGYNVALMLGGKNMATYEKNITNISAAMKKGGSDIQDWNLVQDNFNFKIDQAKEALSAFMISLGQKLLPMVGSVVGAITPVITAFTKWITQSNALNGAISIISNAFKTVSTAISSVVRYFSLFDLSAITYQWNQLTNAVHKMTAPFNEVKSSAASLSPALTTLRNSISILIDSGIKAIADVLSNLKGPISVVAVNIADLKNNFSALFSVIGGIGIDIFNRIVGSIHVTGSSVTSFISNGLNKLSSVLFNVSNTVNKFTQYLKNIDFTSIIKSAQQLGSQIGTNIKPVIDQISQIAKVAQDIGKSFLSNVKPALSQIIPMMMNVSPAVNIFQALSTHAQELGRWFQTSVVPALKQAEPGFKNLIQAIGGLMPVLVTIGGVVKNTFQAAFTALLPVFEKVVPLVIQLAGYIANGLGSAIKFLTPYLNDAIKAIGEFVTAIVQRVVPIIMQWISNINDFAKVWQEIWPHIAPILQGVWDEVVGIVKIAWAIVAGLIKVGLDLMSGNWSQAWIDIQDMFKGIWDGIVTYFSGAWETLKAIVSAMIDGVIALFQGLYDDLVGHSIIPDLTKAIVDFFTKLGTDLLASVQTIYKNVTTWFQNIITDGQKIWNGLLTGIQKIMGNVSTWFGTWFTGLSKNFSQWTTNLMKMFTDGITNGINDVKTAATNVANTVKSILGIHSPAETGPLSTSNQWMPNMVDMFVQGINQGEPAMKNAVTVLATTVTQQIQQLNQQVQQQTTQISTSIRTMATQLQSQSSTINNTLSTLSGQIKTASAQINTDISQLGTQVTQTTQQITQQLAMLQSQVQATVTPIGPMITQVSQQVTVAAAAITDSVNQAVQKAQSMLQDLSKSVDKTQQDLSKATATMSNNIQDSNKTVQKSTDDMTKGVDLSLSHTGNALTDFQNNFSKLVDGVKKGAADLLMTVSGLAQSAADFLMHSTPKKGPLHGDDKWGQHLVENFTTGIQNGIPQLTKTAQVAANSVNDVFTNGNSAIANAFLNGKLSTNTTLSLPNSSSSLTNTQPMIITMNIDGKQVGKVAANYQAKELRVQGSIRNR